MRKAVTKALYLFLCSILGMVLFAMLHRAIFVLYDLVLILDFNTYSLGMSEATLLVVDFFTMLIALFFGGWYGIVLGMDWYSSVYGASAEAKAGLFHGFVPHNWRAGEKQKKSDLMPASNLISQQSKIKVTQKVTSKPKAVESVAVKSESQSPVVSGDNWSFEDFLKATPEPKKRATIKKSTVASKATSKVASSVVQKSSKSKTARKPVAKKAVKIIPE